MSMMRRTFLQAAAALLPAVGLSIKEPPARLYSVSRGHQGDVYLNGHKVAYAVSCKTGRRGWVQYMVTDADGVICMKADNIVRERRRGHVRFVPALDCGRKYRAPERL